MVLLTSCQTQTEAEFQKWVVNVDKSTHREEKILRNREREGRVDETGCLKLLPRTSVAKRIWTPRPYALARERSGCHAPATAISLRGTMRKPQTQPGPKPFARKGVNKNSGLGTSSSPNDQTRGSPNLACVTPTYPLKLHYPVPWPPAPRCGVCCGWQWGRHSAPSVERSD